MSVYGDAVFAPLLRLESFQQEGHRIAWEDERPRVDGVVFNEMKGVHSTHDSIVSEFSCRLLFPETSYCFDAGGEPTAIPELKLRRFRRPPQEPLS